MNNLHAKALRAAEWWNSTGKGTASYAEWLLWCVTENGESWADDVMITDRIFIAFCEDRDWIDTAELHIPTEEEAPDICLEMMGQFMNELDTAEDEGVEWNEWVTVQDGNFTVSVNNRTDGSGYDWDIWCNRSSNMIDSGSKPTRAEARRAALEAAKGMG